MSQQQAGVHPALIKRHGLMLVVVDIQDNLAAAMPRRAEVVAAVCRLIRVAGVLGAPIVVTRQYPKGLGDTVPEVGEALAAAEEAGAGVAIIDKLDFDCTGEPAFVHALDATQRGQAVIAGMEAHICVTQTALSLAAGGRVSPHVVADAVCSRRDADRDSALARLRMHGVDVPASESVIYEAVGRAGTAEFREVLKVVKEG